MLKYPPPPKISPAGFVRLADALVPGAGEVIVKRVYPSRYGRAAIDPTSETRSITYRILTSNISWTGSPEGYRWWANLYNRVSKVMRSQEDNPEIANLKLMAGIRRRRR